MYYEKYLLSLFFKRFQNGNEHSSTLRAEEERIYNKPEILEGRDEWTCTRIFSQVVEKSAQASTENLL